MIIKFTVENYLSFKGKVTLNFQAGTIKEHRDNVFLTTIAGDPLLKSLGLFGKNASGKSNIIKAIIFVRDLVLNSSKESNSSAAINVTPFLLSTEVEKKASTFEVIFIVEGKKYRYGFSVSKKAVESEWLFQTVKRKEEILFIRAYQNFDISKYLRSESKNKVELFTEITRPNSLFISILAQFNNDIGAQISNWFYHDLIIAQDTAHFNLIQYTAGLMSDSDYRKLISDIIQKSDLGIYSIEEKLKPTYSNDKFTKEFLNFLFNDDKERFFVKTTHLKYNDQGKAVDKVVFDLIENESFGTQKFFGMLGPILFALKERKVLWVDEIDARMHSLLFESVVNLFNSKKYNQGGSQLIFTSHNPYILKKGLRRDQIVLTEKDKFGISTIRSLYEKSPKVRNDASFDKDYLSGKYGAIPQISQLNLFDSL